MRNIIRVHNTIREHAKNEWADARANKNEASYNFLFVRKKLITLNNRDHEGQTRNKSEQ